MAETHDESCWSTPALVATVAVTELACIELGHFLSFPDKPFATFWPATGLLVAILSRLPLRRWPSVLPVAACVNVLAAVLLHGQPIVTSLAFALTSLLEACLAAVILQRAWCWPFSLNRAPDIFMLVAVGAVLCPAVGATVGASLSSSHSETSFLQGWIIWWASDALGVLVVAPPALLFASRDWKLLRWPRALEAAVVFSLLVVLALGAFGPESPFRPRIIRFPLYLFPVIAWTVYRFGRRGASLAGMTISLIALWGTTRGYGWYAEMRLPLELSASIMYMFIFVVTLTPLVTSTVLESQRRADRRYRAIVDRSPAGIFEADTRGRCVYVNRRWSMLSGLTFEQAQGEGWLTAVHPDDRQECARAWRRAVERRDEEFVAEFRFLSSVGKEVWVYCTAAALHSDEGRITGYLGTLLDISDRRQAEMELQQAKDDLQQRVAERTGELTQANHELHHQMAERARTEERLQEQQGQLMHVSRLSSLGEMAAGLAHEISQPLYAISNYARGSLLRLRSAAVPPDDIAEPLEQIAGEAERAGEILHRIRAFGRRKPAGQVRIDLNELARDAVRLTAFDARARGVEVQLQLSNDLPRLVSDPIQIQQVLVNLLRNAYEAVEDLPQARRCVTIETFRNRTEAGCAVHDMGAGLPADRHRLFEPFFTTKPQGLGLGLAISRSLIESFGGRLWVEPGSTGGATFRFTLPGAENGHDVGDCRADRVSGG